MQFADTLIRPEQGTCRFEHGDHVHGALLRTACAALRSVHDAVDGLVVIAPPFSVAVWNKMRSGPYGYVTEAHAQRAACLDDIPFHDFVTGDRIPDGSDCEFIDGMHGGDVTYTRMLATVAARIACSRGTWIVRPSTILYRAIRVVRGL